MVYRYMGYERYNQRLSTERECVYGQQPVCDWLAVYSVTYIHSHLYTVTQYYDYHHPSGCT